LIEGESVTKDLPPYVTDSAHSPFDTERQAQARPEGQHDLDARTKNATEGGELGVVHDANVTA
jgi:hypothetical protein